MKKEIKEVDKEYIVSHLEEFEKMSEFVLPEVKEGIDLSFVDELSEEELDSLVEGVVYDLLEDGIEIDDEIK